MTTRIPASSASHDRRPLWNADDDRGIGLNVPTNQTAIKARDVARKPRRAMPSQRAGGAR